MARTITSIALGNSSRNAFMRRLRRKETTQRGTPTAPANNTPIR
jgi:hypothetical protein